MTSLRSFPAAAFGHLLRRKRIGLRGSIPLISRKCCVGHPNRLVDCFVPLRLIESNGQVSKPHDLETGQAILHIPTSDPARAGQSPGSIPRGERSAMTKITAEHLSGGAFVYVGEGVAQRGRGVALWGSKFALCFSWFHCNSRTSFSPGGDRGRRQSSRGRGR